MGTSHCRFQEKCQPCDNAGDDENRYDSPQLFKKRLQSFRREECVGDISQGLASDLQSLQDMSRERTTGTMKLRSGMSWFGYAYLGSLLIDISLSRRYRTMEAAANRLQKEAKGYLDSLRGVPIFRNTTVYMVGHCADRDTLASNDGLSDAHCGDD